MAEKPRSLFQKAIDALLGRNQKAAPEKGVAGKPKSLFDKAVDAAKDRDGEKGIGSHTDPGKASPGQRKGIVTVRSLHVRKDHSTTSETMAGLVRGNEVTFTETWTDGKNTWVKLGPERWAAMLYNGETYIKES